MEHNSCSPLSTPPGQAWRWVVPSRCCPALGSTNQTSAAQPGGGKRGGGWEEKFGPAMPQHLRLHGWPPFTPLKPTSLVTSLEPKCHHSSNIRVCTRASGIVPAHNECGCEPTTIPVHPYPHPQAKPGVGWCPASAAPALGSTNQTSAAQPGGGKRGGGWEEKMVQPCLCT